MNHESTKTMSHHSKRMTYCALLIALSLAVAGCSSGLIVAADNYLTYDHAFNDAAAAKARRSAENLCAQRKQLAVQTRSVCTLTRCKTDYQCVSKENPEEYQPENFMTNQY